jgi:hypothetical protein
MIMRPLLSSSSVPKCCASAAGVRAGMLGEQRQQRERVAAPRLGHPDRMDTGGVRDFRLFDRALEIGLTLPIHSDCQFARH